MRAIIGRELRSYFSSPLGYVFTAVVLLFVGIFTMAQPKEFSVRL